jgi:serine/threonine protein kinase
VLAIEQGLKHLFAPNSCGRAAGENAKLVHNMTYAAPEIIQAAESARISVPVDAAADVWALGLVAMELVTRNRIFPELSVDLDIAEAERIKNTICDQLTGRQKLPWEGDEADAPQNNEQLRPLKRTVRLFRTQPSPPYFKPSCTVRS